VDGFYCKTTLQKNKLRTPIIDAVVALLDKTLSPKAALEKLMSRDVRGEFD